MSQPSAAERPEKAKCENCEHFGQPECEPSVCRGSHEGPRYEFRTFPRFHNVIVIHKTIVKHDPAVAKKQSRAIRKLLDGGYDDAV